MHIGWWKLSVGFPARIDIKETYSYVIWWIIDVKTLQLKVLLMEIQTFLNFITQKVDFIPSFAATATSIDSAYSQQRRACRLYWEKVIQLHG